MKRIIKNNYKFILGVIVGLIISVTSVYAIEAYIESNKVTYTNHNKTNVEEAIDELYERSGIHKEKWVDPILNGADPVLKDPLIPVEITDGGEVYYANENSEWYNYSEKRWANAVILVDDPSNTNYQVGDHIIEDDIESYFVWIPRYQYKIWNLGKYNTATTISQLTDKENDKTNERAFWRVTGGNPTLIDIKFGTYEVYPKMAEPTTTGVYYTHPAFTLGDKDLNGIWVGKFEVGYKNAQKLEDAKQTSEDSSAIIVKPDAYAWIYNTVKGMFQASYNYERELDSHMMKNTEWGAVAYLSHSVYGIGTEVKSNDAIDFKTGHSLNEAWNTSVGYLASTTGNISGIYDMSGGSVEYMASCIDGGGTTNLSTFTNSELTSYMNQGYIDKYPSNSAETTYNNRILGDATGELGPFYQYHNTITLIFSLDIHSGWYSDFAVFVPSRSPWFVRGCSYDAGVASGQFSFYMYEGGKHTNAGFRLLLAPTN